MLVALHSRLLVSTALSPNNTPAGALDSNWLLAHELTALHTLSKDDASGC
jgi:hypothetical protein